MATTNRELDPNKEGTPFLGMKEGMVGIPQVNVGPITSQEKKDEQLLAGAIKDAQDKADEQLLIGAIKDAQNQDTTQNQVTDTTKTEFIPKNNDVVVDIAEEKKGVTPEIKLDRATFKTIIGKKENDRSEEEKSLIRQYQAGIALGETPAQIFGETTTGLNGSVDTTGMNEQAKADIAKVQEETKKALDQKQTDIDTRLAQAKENIKTNGEERMKVLDRSLSFSGFARSTAGMQKRDEIQQAVNAEIAQAQAKADLEMQLFKAQQEGASAETISAINKNLAEATAKLQEAETTNAIAVAKATQELGLKGMEALNALIEGTTQGIDAKEKGYDEKASLALGYVSDKFGNPLVTDEDGKAIPYEGNDLGVETKINTFKDGNENTYVYKNGQLDSIIQNDGTILQGDAVNVANVPATVKASKEEADRIALEQQLRKEFNGNDLIKTFTDIKGNYQRIQAAKNANSAAGDIALVFSFMKMLDPGSVVREGEFATAQNAAGIPEQIRNLYNKAQTGERLNDKQREDFLGRAKDIFNFEKENAASVRNQFVRIAEDAGARTDFITGAFDDLTSIGGNNYKDLFDDTEMNQLDELFPESSTNMKSENTSSNVFKTSSGKTFNLDLSGFKSLDQTSSTKADSKIISNIEKDINRVAKGSNIKANDVAIIATNRNLDPAILAAFLRNDSSYGTQGLGSRNNNPGNVGQYDRLGTQGVEGYKTIQEGIDAAAQNLESRIKAFKSLYPDREPTAYELATGKSKEGKKFFGVYMTDPKGPQRVEDIYKQLIS